MTTPPPTSPARRLLWIGFFLAAATVAAYWPVTGCQFLSFDDRDFITENPIIQAGLTAQGFHYVWTAEVARNWHPVTLLSHMLDCQLFGLRPGWHHATNLLLHVANTLLLFAVLRRMTGAVWRSTMVAALFALHPLHVESVAWIAERKDVLSAFFWWLALWAWLEYADARPASRLKPKTAYVLSLFLFALGLMSKPMVVTLPCVLLLLDFWPLRRFRFAEEPPRALKESSNRSKSRKAVSPASPPAARRPTVLILLLEKIPFFALSAILCAITFAVQKHGGSMLDAQNLPLHYRLANACISYVRYAANMFWPRHLAGLYLRLHAWPAWEVYGAAFLLLAVTAWVVSSWRARPWLAFGWFWYLGTLVPVIGLVQVGMQTMADRYTYLPLVGLFLMLVWGAAELAQRYPVPSTLPPLLAGLCLGACFLLTVHQLRFWRDSESFFKRMIDVTEDNYMAHYNLGCLYKRRNQINLAIAEYQQALAEEPIYADAHNNLAGIYLDQKRYDEAISHYLDAARGNPGFFSSFNLANAYADAASARNDTNLFALANATYQQALQLNPASSEAHNDFGLTWQAQHRDREAIAEFQEAVRAQPDFEEAHLNLAKALARTGRNEEAVQEYHALQRLNPAKVEYFNSAGVCAAMQGNMEAAAREFARVIQMTPQNSSAYGNLANALAAQNKFDEAGSNYFKALQINPRDYQTEFNLGITLLRQDRRKEARTHFEAVLRLHPNDPEALRALAQLDAQPP